MDKANKEYYHVRRDTTEQIQEGLEAAQEIKSYNGEAAYCDRLDKQRYMKPLCSEANFSERGLWAVHSLS